MEAVELPDSAWAVAHMSGDGCLARINDGNSEHFLTGGVDCTLHLHNAKTLAPVSDQGVGHHEAGLTAVAAAACGTVFATGCEDGAVRLFGYPANQLLALPTRFSLPVRALALSPDGSTLAAGGDDEEVRVVSVSDPEACSLAVTLVHPAKQSLRSAAFDPKVRDSSRTRALRLKLCAASSTGVWGRAGRRLRTDSLFKDTLPPPD